MANLIDVIPHTGYGAALFPFLDARDLENLKQSCKTLKNDVSAHLERYGAATPTEWGLFVRKDGKLYVKHEGQLYDDFRIEYTPDASPITQEECDAMLQSYEARWSKQREMWKSLRPNSTGQMYEKIYMDEIRARVTNGYWGCITVHPHDLTKVFWPKLFRTKAENDKWHAIYEAMKA